jgi:DUF1680 family protein
LFLASTLDWRERGITLEQITRFPDSDTTRLEFTLTKPQMLKLAIRQPGWCAAMSVSVNGRRKTVGRRPGGYFSLRRVFRSGDVVEVRLPMSLEAKPLPNAPEYAALMYGPIVLAGRMGTQGLKPGAQLIVNERESGNMLKADIVIPRWTKPLADLAIHTTRTDPSKLRFRTTGFDAGASVELIPWFRLTAERYNLYWRTQPEA